MPQFLQLRFGNRSYNFLVIYSLISILVVWLGGALYAGGLIISQIFEWSLMQSMIIVAVIATSFTAIGGVKGSGSHRYLSVNHYYLLVHHPRLHGYSKDRGSC